MKKKEQSPDPSTPTTNQQPPQTEPRRIAAYLLASGPDMGRPVAVFPVGVLLNNEETKQTFSDLALVDTPDVLYQTKARFSEDNEPGTWHWA